MPLVAKSCHMWAYDKKNVSPNSTVFSQMTEKNGHTAFQHVPGIYIYTHLQLYNTHLLLFDIYFQTSAIIYVHKHTYTHIYIAEAAVWLELNIRMICCK